MLINFLNHFERINEIIYGCFDNWIEGLSLSEWLEDAICDSVHLIPFLFIIFLCIEIFERYFSHKIKDLSSNSKKFGPLIGAMLAGLPQCGFSVIATPLYVNKLITRGTLIAIYISTSDEAIPILLSNPAMFKEIMPILSIKILLGIISGYLVDLILPNETLNTEYTDDIDDVGCCSHHVAHYQKRELIYHPLKHTISVFLMILIVSIGLNYCFDAFGNDVLNKILLNNSALQIIPASIIGLIPNCAVSVLLTMLYMSGILSFASVISGLSSSAGLGLIVLFKQNPKLSDSFKIVGILLSISIISGLLLFFACK